MSPKVYDLTFEQPRGNSLGAQMKEVIDFLEFLQGEHDPENIIGINLTDIRFVHPLFTLALSSLIDDLDKKGYSYTILPPISEDCSHYLDLIRFPRGIRPDELGNWENVLSKYQGKRYLPIINFSTFGDKRNSTITNNVLSKINSLIKVNLNLDVGYETAISYLISEITDNIIEHSGVERGWLMTQYYPTTEYLDICIIDTGRSILGSYHAAGRTDVYNDEQAIDMAINGVSTKSPERGTGIRTSKAISLIGLQGDFTIFSGKALLYKDIIVDLPISWPGTFVAMRIKKGVDGFDFYSFV